MDKVIEPLEFSKQLLYQVKLKKSTKELVESFEAYPMSSLKANLKDDRSKKVFWINCYNAYFQILRVKGFQKPDIYRKKLINLAGTSFSLDDIEHGILRRNRYKYSLGYVQNIFASRIIKSLVVDQIDYRIHFALNCGAKSCPPIAFYELSSIDTQLDLATQSFLEQETIMDEEGKIIFISALFKWFAADFGSKAGIIDIYRKQLQKDISGFSIKYASYSWDEHLDNFVDHPDL